jgi:Flp pilus assembly pilin Flp
VSHSEFHSVLLSHGYSVISGRASSRGARQPAEEVNPLQKLSQKLYANFVTTFSADEGQTMAEYGIVLALITLAVVGTITALGGAIGGKLDAVVNVLK